MASIAALVRLALIFAIASACWGFSMISYQGMKPAHRYSLQSCRPGTPATTLFAKAKKSKSSNDKKTSTDSVSKTQPVTEVSPSSASRSVEQASAQAAAKAAESYNLFETDKEEQSRKSQNRIDKFERELREVVVREKSIEELDRRGTRLEGTEKTDQLDDTMIRDLLLGKAKPKKDEKKDRLRTETGEELFLSEFAPGATISPYARPSGPDASRGQPIPPPFEGFDPLNPPLPSELARLADPRAADDLEARLAAGELPAVSELDSPSGQRLYDDFTSGVQDDALFRIKSVFDSRAGNAPGTPPPVPAADRPARAPPPATPPPQRLNRALVDLVVDDDDEPRVPLGRGDVGSLDDMLRRDMAALRRKSGEQEERAGPESAVARVKAVADGIPAAVGRGIGVIVAFDFFAVLFFLGWLGVSIVYQFAACGGLTREGGPICANPLYDQWYALWTPVIQPLLGVLMLGTVIQGTINSVFGPKEDA